MERRKSSEALRWWDAEILFCEGDIVGKTEAELRNFDDLQIRVVDQVSEGDRVVSRWVMTGSNRGRRAELSGITVSRMDGGRIVEDWTALDSLELLRQLGLVRTLLAAPRLLGALRA